MSPDSTSQRKHAELSGTHQNARHPAGTPKIPMEVLSLGMPRTGTASMQLALNILGIPCYHGLTLLSNTQDCSLWDRALDAKFFNTGPSFTRNEWDGLLGSYGAVADLPAVAFAEDLIHTYPESKVVLVDRDIEKWYKSFNEGVMENVWSPISKFVAWLDPHFVGRLGGTSGRWTRGWMGAHSLEDMQEKARPKYREHYALIQKLTPTERLLRFNLNDGWKPLCDFLQRPVPDVPFPRVNEAAALKERIKLIMLEGIKNALLSPTFLLIAGTLFAVGLAWLLSK